MRFSDIIRLFDLFCFHYNREQKSIINLKHDKSFIYEMSFNSLGQFPNLKKHGRTSTSNT